MALTTTNVRRENAGSINITTGSFTFTESDVENTFAVEGGWVVPLFMSEDTSGPYRNTPFRYSLSTSAGLTTITVYVQEGITTGKFIIFHR